MVEALAVTSSTILCNFPLFDNCHYWFQRVSAERASRSQAFWLHTDGSYFRLKSEDLWPPECHFPLTNNSVPQCAWAIGQIVCTSFLRLANQNHTWLNASCSKHLRVLLRWPFAFPAHSCVLFSRNLCQVTAAVHDTKPDYFLSVQLSFWQLAFDFPLQEKSSMHDWGLMLLQLCDVHLAASLVINSNFCGSM